jgi:4-hydroxythreonine-4-phosphate dehydrogenase
VETRDGSSRVIGLTLGDAAGIGPEVIDGALASGKLDPAFEYRVIGNRQGVVPGAPTPESARDAIAALEEAVKAGLAGDLAAVVTGPISKIKVQAEGFPFPGQTEFFAARTRTPNFAMCLTGGALTVALVTAHVSLRDVPVLLSAPEIVRVGGLLAEFLSQRLGRRPRVAVAGLNPHAGEGGVLGREEIELIQPATMLLQGEHGDLADFAGPLSPDTVFNRAVEGQFDGVLCMYHDQGLIPLKLHAFDSGVNVTLGLPFPRTSPDHGTAFDLAGKGQARPDSMIAAIRLATEMVNQQASAKS